MSDYKYRNPIVFARAQLDPLTGEKTLHGKIWVMEEDGSAARTYRNFKGPFLTRAWLRRRSFLGQWSRFSRYFLRCFRVSSVFDGGPGGKVGSWSCGGACRVGGFDF